MINPPIGALPQEAREEEILDFVNEAVREGTAFYKAQKGYDKIQESIDAIMGDGVAVGGGLSNTRANHVGKISTDLSALMTDIKPFWEYKTYNKRYEATQMNLGKLSGAWYTNRFIDLRFNEVVKYWIAGGTGWANPYYNEDEKDLDVNAIDPRDVMPIRPRNKHSVQDAMGVIERSATTTNYLKSKFPEKAYLIQPDRDGSAISNLANTRAGRLMSQLVSPFHARLFSGDKPASDMERIPTADLFTVYVDDRRRNEKSFPVLMGPGNSDGTPETNWSYIVKPGESLYPRKRCIVCTRSAVLYDGPSIYWHGLFPYCKLTLDPWPWSWLGKAPLWDILPLQKSLDRVLRVVDDHIEKVARPDIIGDKNSISEQTMKMLDSRRAGLKIRMNALAGKGVQLQYPQPLDQSIPNQIQFLIEQMKEIAGVKDATQLMGMNQLPSTETIDKILETMSPAMRGRSRFFESFMREFAIMTAYNFAQFYTMPMRLQILGPQGVTKEDFDFDPGTMIPDHVHSEDFDERGMVTQEAFARGPLPRYDRAREFMRQFSFHVAPGSLLAASEIERKLLYLQLARAGLIDFWTLLEVLDIPNVGEPPAGAQTITDRLAAQNSLGLGMNVSPAGRKATGQTMPRMTTKES